MNEVNARRAWLQLGWVTVFGRYTISGCNQPTRSTQLCDPIWHVSSRSSEASCELLYSVYLYLYLVRYECQ